MKLFQSIRSNLSRILGNPELAEQSEAELDQTLSEMPELNAEEAPSSDQNYEAVLEIAQENDQAITEQATTIQTMQTTIDAQNEKIQANESALQAANETIEKLQTDLKETNQSITNLVANGTIDDQGSEAPTLTTSEQAFVNTVTATKIK